MTYNLQTLLQSYGWQLAIVGFLGTLLVGLLKKPLNSLIWKNKEYTTARDQAFDVVAFITSFIIGVALGSLYTYLATRFGWVDTIDKRTCIVYVPTFEVYLSNGIGVWSFQVIYYQIWKKLGVKRIFDIIISKFKKPLDVNKDDTIDLSDAAVLVANLLQGGKITVADIVSTVKKVAPEVVNDVLDTITIEAEEAAETDISANVEKLGETAQAIVSAIPQKNISSVASELVKKAEDKLQEVAETPVATEPKRPTIKF